MRRSLLLSTVLLFTTLCKADDYKDAWISLNKNDLSKAKEQLIRAMKVPETAADAYATYFFIADFENTTGKIKDYPEKIYELYKNPYPYIYSMWFNQAVVGETGGSKKEHNLRLLDKLIADPNCNGSLKASAHYSKGFNLLNENKMKECKQEWDLMGGITSWKYAGPFDNLSNSGFYKQYEPLYKPEDNNIFKSLNNADVKWFEPAIPEKEGWNSVKTSFANTTAIVFAQAFVFSPIDQNVLIGAGLSGAIKIWVNDEIVIAEPKERTTELDTYKSKITLKTGYNRILVQVGFTDNNYSNFLIRIIDNNYNPVSGLTSTTQYQKYPSVKTDKQTPEASIPLFAESYFIDKIKAEPENLLNYLLLGQTYYRNLKTYEARRIYEQALKKAPDNSILKFELIQCLLKTENRTKMLEIVESLKEKDPNCLLTLILNVNQQMDDKKYDDVQKSLDNYKERFGADEFFYESKIKLDDNLSKDNDLVSDIIEAYNKFPESVLFNRYFFFVKSKRLKDVKGGLKIYEKYLKNKFNYEITLSLVDEYLKQGMVDKAQRLIEDAYKRFSYDPELATKMATFFFNMQNYQEAINYCKIALNQNPYCSTYWKNIGTVYEALSKKQDAIDAYKKTVYYSPNMFSVHKKIRQLEEKLDLMEAFPKYDVTELIKKSNITDTEHEYCYILDDQNTIVYPEGTNELYKTMLIKILNRDGIDFWKNVNIPYNSNVQELHIEKSEVIKPNGSKIAAETNGSEMVFANIEVGDVIHLKYSIMNYSYGRLAREFWDQFNFSAYQAVEHARYNLLIAKNIGFHYKVMNDSLAPAVQDYDNDYKLYTWEKRDIAAIENEPYMPPLNDVGSVLHISTLKSWKNIAEWYNDLSAQKTEDDIEVKDVLDNLFPAGTEKLGDMEKAKIIYEYIAANFNYSSVSFRQSDYVPQSASKTISTHLGDCKDLSSLFVALSKMAGLKANLVLIDTRDNGQKEIVLPSFNFNHCIAKLQANNQEYYLELTDKSLPFKSLPNSLYGALALNISNTLDKKNNDSLICLTTKNRTMNRIKRTFDIKVEGSNLVVTEKVVKYGNLTSGVRTDYANMSSTKQKEDFEKGMNKRYNKTVSLKSLTFSNLDNTTDSVAYSMNYVVQDALVDIGDLKSFQMIYPDMIASLNNFTKESRLFPIDYWSYEDTDNYDTEVNIKAPEGKTFVQLPTDQKLKFNGSVYSLQFKQKKPNELSIYRKASMARENISTDEYKNMKTFFDGMTKIESKYIVMK